MQLIVLFAGPAGHGLHELPQLLTSVFETHALPQRWKPALQVKPQAPPVQTGTALVTVGQLAHDAPHWVMLASETHAPAQSWKPAAHW